MPMILISLLSVGSAMAQGFSSPIMESGAPLIAAAATKVSDRPEPPGLGKQILGGVAYGSGGLLAGGAAGAALLSAGCALWGEDCGFAGIGGAFMGGVLGFAGAFPYGVYRFGTDADYSGSLMVTYASALLGSAVGFGGTALATRLQSEDAWFQSIMLGMAGAPIGAIIGFNLTRGPRNGMPKISLAPLPDGGWAGRLVWTLR
jgi:hypothetical protein